jgi:hypothetical protein
MQMTRQLIFAIFAALFILAVGVYHGLATDRWSEPKAADQPGSRLADLPLVLGDWKGEVLPRGDDDDPKTAAVNFRFVNSHSSRWMLIAISSGRAGRVAVHNPEHCYLGSGYQLVDEIRLESLSAGPHGQATFWTGHFQKKRPTGLESIRIYWGWTADGDWQAPTYPRLYFAGAPRLHKLYMIHPVPQTESPDDREVYREFMVQYLNELNRRLAP